VRRLSVVSVLGSAVRGR